MELLGRHYSARGGKRCSEQPSYCSESQDASSIPKHSGKLCFETEVQTLNTENFNDTYSVEKEERNEVQSCRL